MPVHQSLKSLPSPAGEPTFPIIDSHIHLFAKAHLPSLSWYTRDGPLSKQHSVNEYREAIENAPFPPHGQFRGFVFVETDRKFSVSEDNGGWKQPLEELKFLSRIATGQPKEGEGHLQKDAKLCIAIVGWAPVPGGRQAMERYRSRVREAVVESVIPKIVGWRYLVQDKPKGTMLTDEFIDSLKWMGEQDYSFDLGVDMRSGGLWQLEEACAMISKAISGVAPDKQVRIVINHMCKPDMRSSPYAPRLFQPDHASFVSWQRHLKPLAAFPNTFMKLSGAFSELPPLPDEVMQQRMSFWERQKMLLDTTEHVMSYVTTALDMFGPDRVIFGSDWPVCNVSGGGNECAFKNWMMIVRILVSRLSSEDQAKLWGLTAAKVYNIQLERYRD